MKKGVFFATMACLCLGITACGGKANKGAKTNDEPQKHEEREISTEDDSSEKKDNMDFSMIPENFSFQSGAGGWSTDIEIKDDGSFEGTYHDSDMGSTGDGYPGGTMYYCEFNGKFGPLKATDKDNVFKTRLEAINITTPSGTEEIVDEILYVYGGPYGFEDGKDFYLYAPKADLSGLGEDVRSWIPVGQDIFSTMPVGSYALLNKASDYMFFGREEDSIWSRTFSNTERDDEYYVEFSPSTYYGGSYLLFGTPALSSANRLMVAVPWDGETVPAKYECKEMFDDNDNRYEVSVEKMTDEDITVSMKSKPAYDLTKWGGDADGNIKVTLHRKLH